MTAGLGLFGLAGYVFVALTGHALPRGEANLAIAFYFLVNVVGPGIFYALEQVTSRSVSGPGTSTELSQSRSQSSSNPENPAVAPAHACEG